MTSKLESRLRGRANSIRQCVIGEETRSQKNAPQGGDLSEKGNAIRWPDDLDPEGETDEVHEFESASEETRVQLAILLIRKRGRSFRTTTHGGTQEAAAWHQLQSASPWNGSGDLFGSTGCLPELLQILPWAASKFPDLVTPEFLVKGLLRAPNGIVLLVEALRVNPDLIGPAVETLASVAAACAPASEEESSGKLVPASSNVKALAGRLPAGSTPAGHAGNQTTPSVGSGKLTLPTNPGQPVPTTPDGTTLLAASAQAQVLEAATRAAARICQVVPSCVVKCRAVLAEARALPGLTLLLTVQVIGDELAFLSAAALGPPEGRHWLFRHMAANQRPPPPGAALPNAWLRPQGMLFGSVAEEGQGQDSTAATSAEPEQFPLELPSLAWTVHRVRTALLINAKRVFAERGWAGQTLAHLQLFCILVRTGPITPLPQELDFWLTALAATWPDEGRPRLASWHQVKGGSAAGVAAGVGKDTVNEGGGVELGGARDANSGGALKALLLGLAFFCLIPGLGAPSLKLPVQAAIHRLFSCVQATGVGETSGRKRGRDDGNADVAAALEGEEEKVKQVTVWVLLQLLLKRFAELAPLVRAALGVHVTVQNAALRDLADVAAAPGGPLHDPVEVIRAAATLRPRKLISGSAKEAAAGSPEQLAVSSLQALLEGALLAKYGIDISAAIVHMIGQATLPLHQALPSLVQSYAEASMRSGKALPPGNAAQFQQATPSLPGLPEMLEAPCVALLEGRALGSNQVATLALSTYYLLCRHVAGGCADEAAATRSDDDGQQEENLFESIPWGRVEEVMGSHWLDLEALLPHWQSLLLQRVPAQHRLAAGISSLANNRRPVPNPAPSPEANDLDSLKRLAGDLRQPHLAKIILATWRLTGCLPMARRNKEVAEIWCREQIALQTVVPALLLPKCQHLLQLALADWWARLPPACHMALAPTLLTALHADAAPCSAGMAHAPASKSGQGVDAAKKYKWSLTGGSSGIAAEHAGNFAKWDTRMTHAGGTLTNQKLVTEPMTILAVDKRTFRIAPLLQILLGLLERHLAANRRSSLATMQSSQLSGGSGGVGGKGEELASGLLLQDSAICQMLLEACQVDVGLGDEDMPRQLAEARALLIGCIERLVSNSPLLLKLLLFQGFALPLVGVLVEHLPAMADTWGIAEELLQQPHQHRQIMGLALIAELSVRHPSHAQALPSAELALTHVSYVQHHVAGSRDFLEAALPFAVRCGIAFPQLIVQATAIVQACVRASAPLVSGGRPRDGPLHAAALCSFSELVRRRLLIGRPQSAPAET